MKDERKTKKQLIEELNEVRQRVEQLGETSTEPAIRTLMNASSDAAILIEPNGIILTVNTISAERMGMSIDELEGKNIFDLIPPERAEPRKKLIKKVVRSGKAEHFESVKYADKVLAVSICPIINAKGRVSHLAVFEDDITERVRAEEKLKESEDRYRNLFEGSPQGIITADLEGEITSCNSAFLELSGFSENEIVGKHFTKLPTLLKENLGEFLEVYDDLMEEKAPKPFEFICLHKDGTTRLADARIGLLKEQGQLIGVQVIVQDITERVQAEEALINREKRLQSLFENVAIGIAIADPKGRYQQVNSHYLEMYGYDSEEELFQKTVREITHPDDREATRKAQMAMAKGEINFYRDEKRFLRKDGSFFWGDVSVSPIKELNGEINAFTAIVVDITESKKAEEELHESHNYLNNILNGMFAGMLVLDLNYEIVDVNSSFLDEYNISREEVIGHKCYEITHQSNQPCDSSECVCPMRLIAETTSPTQVEHRHVNLEGEERFVEINFFPLFEADGEVGRVVEIIHDVTERVQAEEQARIEAGRAKAMARIATSLNTHLDVEAVGKAICEEAASAFGVPLVSVCLYDSERDELVPAGQFGTPSINMIDVQSIPCEFYCEPIQQSDPVVVFPNIQNTSEFPKLDLFTNLDIRTLVSAKIQRDEQFIGRMNILTIGEERTFSKDDLTLLQGLANQAAIALENARLFQSERDSHHKSEALRRAALVLTSTMAMDQVLEGILAELQKVVPFDNASVQLLEKDQLKLVTGRGFSNLADLIGTSFPARGRFRYSRVLETRKPFSKTIEGPRFDQQNSPEEEQRSWLGVPLLIGDRIIGIITLNKLKPGFYTENHGEIAMAFAAAAANAIENAQLFRDLQDKMQILKETRNLLVQNEKLAAIGELVSGIAHELNNPISAILLLAQDSLQEESTQEIKNNLDKIVSESRRTAKIVRDLLAFSKQRSPDVDLIQLDDVLVYTLDLLRDEIGKNNIKVTTEFSKDMPPVLIDPLQIQQVVINIVNNACQAMAADPENAYLRITTETGPSIFLPESGTPQVVRIMFQDSGAGIHTYVLPRVFDPFFTTKPLGQGTGLGLSICHGIVNEHGGHIWVESEFGKGATFFVELPVASLDEQRPAITKEQPKQLLSPSKYRILIIDDEESLLEILSRVLRRRGYQVVAVNNGEEGLDHAINTNPDLILCDLLMPGLSGQDIYFYLKSHASELLNHIIFTTGDTLSPETRQFLEETDVRFLRKPFELDHLIDVVEEAIIRTG
jgi:two-component system NtrC family sensor kinase